MPFSPYLNFNGNTAEALEFYKKAFGAEEPEIMYYKEMPPSDVFPIDEKTAKLIMHADMKIKDTVFMFSDIPDGTAEFSNGITLLFASDSLEEIKKAYDFLKEGGKVEMELQETFWSKAYGYVVDKFGVGWQFNLSSE